MSPNGSTSSASFISANSAKTSYKKDGRVSVVVEEEIGGTNLRGGKRIEKTPSRLFFLVGHMGRGWVGGGLEKCSKYFGND